MNEEKHIKIILIGIQGAGKSTQGNLLQEKLTLPYLSTGHIFRELSHEKTSLGRYIKETMNAGFLIPDDKTVQIVEEYLKRPEYKKGYIMDGFPRTVTQAEAFENGITKAIYLKVSDKEALWRLAYRDSEGRNDETLPAILKRIELFHKFTEPVIAYYRQKGKLVEIDGERSIDKIHQEIIQKIVE
jgi:adenylate kinase